VCESDNKGVVTSLNDWEDDRIALNAYGKGAYGYSIFKPSRDSKVSFTHIPHDSCRG